MADHEEENTHWNGLGEAIESVKENARFQKRAKELVVLYQLKRGVPISPSQVYIVWFAKTLQNWKALVSTDLSDGLYYEITYNGDKAEAYLDVYIKSDNLVISDDGEGNPNPFN